MDIEKAIDCLKADKEYLTDMKICDGEEMDVAIKALEEMRQYRAIGTVEECRENKEFLDFLYNIINPNDMEQYLSMYNCSDEKIN